MATFLPMALPPIVNPEMSAVTTVDTTILRQPKLFCSSTTMTVAVEPLTMPQMSPTTSLQNEATFSALRMRYSASFAPLTRCAAIELNGLGFAAVTATPMISNRMPSAMNSSRISVAVT